MSSSGGVVLQRMPQTTALYQPTQLGKNENMFFLRWVTDAPPETILLEKTWAEAGAPPNVGYFLFLDAPPTGAQAFEQTIRGLLLDAPTASAFAWVVTDSPVTVTTLLKTKLNLSNAPCIDGNTQLALLPGSQGVGFGDGSPILAAYSDGFITGFFITNPPLTGAQPPTASGVSLPLAGDFVGCVQFAGLTNVPGKAGAAGDSAVKALVNASIDPLNPLDTSRNQVTFTGASLILTQGANGYHISRAS